MDTDTSPHHDSHLTDPAPKSRGRGDPLRGREHAPGRPATLLMPYAAITADPADNQRKTPPDSALEDEMLAEMQARVLAGQHPQKTPVEVDLTTGRLVSGFTRHRVLGRLVAWADGQSDGRDRIDAWGGTVWASAVAPANDYARRVLNLRENLIRSELPPADLAESVSRTRADTGHDVAQIARDIGRPLSSVANLVRAYEGVTPEMWAAFRKGAITQKQVIALAAQVGEEQQLSFDVLMGKAEAPKKPSPARGEAAEREPEDEHEDDEDDKDDSGAGGQLVRRVGVLESMLKQTPGLRESTHDFAAGLRAALRFLRGDESPERFRDRVEAVCAAAAIREARPAEPPNPRQLVIPGASAAENEVDATAPTPSAIAAAKAQAATKAAKAPAKAQAATKAAKAPAKAQAATKAAKASAKAQAATKAAKAMKGRR